MELNPKELQLLGQALLINVLIKNLLVNSVIYVKNVYDDDADELFLWYG